MMRKLVITAGLIAGVLLYKAANYRARRDQADLKIITHEGVDSSVCGPKHQLVLLICINITSCVYIKRDQKANI